MERSYVLRMLEEYKRVITTLDRSPYYYTDAMITIRSIQKNNFEQSVVTKYLKFWMRKLSSCDCKDPYLTAVFINLYNAIKECTLTTLKNEITSLLLLNKDLTDVREGVNYELMNVLRVVEREDWDFLKVLILYGIIRPKETLTSSVKLTHHGILRDFFDQIVLNSEENRQFIDGFRKNVLRRLDLNAFSSVDEDGKAQILRKYNVVKSLACQHYVWGTHPEDTIRKCIDFYFQVISDPFVTVREIEDVIEIPQTSCSIFDIERLRSFLTNYRRLFPESDVLKPRSLQHLSRCAAREHLCKYGLLPEVVSRLMIPKDIKDYLLVVDPES